jgi:predicted nucleic acid-binding protein
VYALQAQPVMERAVELFSQDEKHQRSYALNLIGMASVHLLQKEPEAAASSAQQAVDIATRIRSERVNTRIRKTAEAALGEFRDVGDVVRLRDRIDTELPEFTRPQAV